MLELRSFLTILCLVLCASTTAKGGHEYPSHFKVQIDSDVYKITDRRNGDLRTHAWVVKDENGTRRLRLDFATKIYSNPYNCKEVLEESDYLKGKAELKKILDHFAGKIEGITTYWESGTNYLAFSKLYSYGVSAELAAARTWTGRQARQNGLTQITVKSIDLEMGSWKDPAIVINFDYAKETQNRSFEDFYKAADPSTRLVFATAIGDESLVAEELMLGTSPNITQVKGRTMEAPLIIAAREGFLGIAKQLVAAGADLNAKSIHFRDFRAVDCAWNSRQLEMYSYLEGLSGGRWPSRTP